MMKQIVENFLYVLLYVLIVCALSALFTYKEWDTMWLITVIFLPFPLVLATENAMARLFGLLGFWAILIMGSLYFKSLFTNIIIVKGESAYTIEKVRNGSIYEYVDSKGNMKSVVVQGKCIVHNSIEKPLRLYKVAYSRYQFMFGDSDEKDIMKIPARSVVDIPNYPDYILDSPPNSIMVRKHGVFSNDKKIIKTVLEVAEY